MSDRRTERVREILDLAMERPSAERAAYVAGAAGGDEHVRTEVLSLLGALEVAGDVLEPPRATQSVPPPAEPLTGLTFGPYVVGERIGEGGMGVVYATRDTRLERTVAVKALPPTLARDPHRRARLEQEARHLASLNHPNIAAIYGIENTPRGPVMILEFVPGRTLAEELASRRLSIDDSIGIARQIARGLESAHAAGIIHRDLKPANIKITPEGVVKILDLGVAKAAPGAMREMGSDSVLRAAATQPGMILGTAAYMSPEQARGRAVDRRTDLWAFGCVLFEMLTSKRAFDGETASDAVAAVLRADPDWSLLPAATSSSVRRLLARCLHKDPEQRLRDAGDAVLELDEFVDDQTPPSPLVRVWQAAAVAAILAFIGLAIVWSRGGSPQPKAQEVRFSVTTPPLLVGTAGSCIALSPDGRLLVYTAGESGQGRRLYSRRLDALGASAIPGTELGFMPFFSPDGRWLGFCEVKPDGTWAIKRIGIDGASAHTICSMKGGISGASWGDDGMIVFAEPGRLLRVPASGGEPVPVEMGPVSPSEHLSQPEVLPGSRSVLYTRWRRDPESWRWSIEVYTFATKERRTVVPDASQPRFVRGSGMLAYQKDGTLLIAPLDQAAMRLGKNAVPIVLTPLGGEASGSYARYAIADDGTFAFVPGHETTAETDLAWFGASGEATTVYRGPSFIWTLRLSPDGSRVAFTTLPPKANLWVLDIERGAPTRLTNSGDATYPVWTPDGKRIAFQRQTSATESHIEWMPADGSAAPEVLYADPNGAPCFPTDFSPDGRLLAISTSTNSRGDTDVFIVPVAGDRKAVRLFDTPADRVGVRFSPDGSLIAYTSVETDRGEIYLQPYPAMDRKILVSTGGGERPDWTADGKRLFYRYGDTIYSVDVSSPPDLRVSKPAVVLAKLPGMRYDAVPDGSRFIMGRPRGEWGPHTTITVVTGAVQRARP